MKLEIFGAKNEEAKELQMMINAWFDKHPKIKVVHIDTFPETVKYTEKRTVSYYNVFIFYEEG